MEIMNPDTDQKLLYVKTKEEELQKRGSLYEAARKCWRLNPDRARDVDYVIAVIDDVCHGVFKPEKWERCVWKGKDRLQFEGHDVSGEAGRIYVGKLVPEDKRRSRNPVRYG